MRCLRYLSRICDNQNLLPKSFTGPLHCTPPIRPDAPRDAVKFSEVWKLTQWGRVVMMKFLKVSTSDSEQARKESFPQFIVYIDAFIDSHIDTDAEILQRGRDMEGPSSSEHPTVITCGNGRKSICDGNGVDGGWENQQVCRGTSGC